MPHKLELRLEREAKKKHLGKKRAGAYVYGTLRKIKLREAGQRVNRKAWLKSAKKSRQR